MTNRNLCLLAISIVFYCLLSTVGYAQRTCATMEVLDQLLKEDPSLKERMDRIEKRTSSFQSSAIDDEIGTITIPVVFHVLYNNETQNLSEAQILSQLDVLNKDFRRLNTDADNVWPQAADSEIEFVMASIDPDGNATNGITRTSTSTSTFGYDNTMKFTSSGGHDAWPAGSYLNIWVCDLSGLLGYAQFPGGSAATDGVVIDYLYTGTIGTATAPFDLGRTATHEVGHWLNLRHIWGDGGCGYDDFVTDTPTSDAANYGCKIGHVSCSTTDMVQNYMDYSDDACMNLFTDGQKSRMRALFQPGGFRESLLTPFVPPVSCDQNDLTLTITFDGYPGDISWEMQDANDSVITSNGPYNSGLSNQVITHEFCLTDGNYTFIMHDSYGDGLCCAEGNGSYLLTVFSDTLINSDGAFGTIQSSTISLVDQYYRFVGPGTQWEVGTNWNKDEVPSNTYMGPITIESGCYKTDGIEVIPPRQIIVKPDAFLSVTKE